jgi:hypothetical protein
VGIDGIAGEMVNDEKRNQKKDQDDDGVEGEDDERSHGGLFLFYTLF